MVAVDHNETSAELPEAETPSRRRYRGKSKAKNWKRDPDGPTTIIRLPLDTSDPRARRHLEKLYSAAFSLKRALRHSARSKCRAYWRAVHERETSGPKAVRKRLGLARESFEAESYKHKDASPDLSCHLTKALAMHIADSVWEGTRRHLFQDASGKTQGEPTIPRYFDFHTIPGRARSHTAERKWETFRLHGSLAGHLQVYMHPDLGMGTRSEDLLGLSPGSSVFAQPTHMKAPVRSGKSWWEHQGAFCVVFSGIPAMDGEDLVLPVRLSQGSGSYPYLHHHLADEDAWHKIDLVRHQDASAPGGWRYEAHLMVLKEPYASPATLERRERAAKIERRGSFDLNVSNCSVVSFDDAVTEVATTVIRRDDGELRRLEEERKAERARSRARERSRRATNAANYEMSKAQAKRQERRQKAGLPEKQVQVPGGPRKASSAGIPKQAYKKDTVGNGYRRIRAAQVEAGAAKTRRKQGRARERAAEIVSAHGANLVTEDVDVSMWARLWGRGIAAFSPGMLRDAVCAEATAVARISGDSGILRAGTRHTALSQHCLCGARVAKTLADRVHRCPECGLVCDRDLLSGALGCFVSLGHPSDPSTARVDYELSRQALSIPGLKEALSESNASPERHHSRRRDGRASASRRVREASARRSAVRDTYATPDETAGGPQGTLPTKPGTHACRAGLSRATDEVSALRGRS
jgi:hypothetical protein